MNAPEILNKTLILRLEQPTTAPEQIINTLISNNPDVDQAQFNIAYALCTQILALAFDLASKEFEGLISRDEFDRNIKMHFPNLTSELVEKLHTSAYTAAAR